MSFIIAIDGTAGTGKGTMAKRLAEKYGFMNIDTGAIYRAMTVEFLNRGLSLNQEQEIRKMLEEIQIECVDQNGKLQVFLNGREVTEEIREQKVNQMVSQLSGNREVRDKATELSRNMAEGKDVIMEGRDIGTVVFPNADVKMYLDATPEERARRRCRQEEEKGMHPVFEEVLANVKMRDENDKSKSYGALKLTEEYTYIDATELSVEQLQAKMEEIIEEKGKRAVKTTEEMNTAETTTVALKQEEKSIKKNGKRTNKKKKDSMWKKTQTVITRAVLRFLYITIFRTTTKNQDRVPVEGPFILCANHVDYIKVPVVVLFTKRKVNFIAKEELFKNPFLKWLGYVFDVIAIKRGKQDMEAMKKSLSVLKRGEVLGLFPEGTRRGMEKNGKAKTGAVYMAIKAGVPIVPVGVYVSDSKIPKIILNYGFPINYSKEKSNLPEKERLEEATKEVMDNIIKLTNEAR